MRPGGHLRRGTLAEVLLEAEQNTLTGAIAVIGDDRRGKVYLNEGRIAHARQSVQREFDEWLALLGLIPSDDPSLATELAARLHTDLAINAPMIKRLGREYVDRVCADLLRLEEGEYRVQEGELVPHGIIESWKVAQVLLNAAATGHADKLDMRPSSKDVRLQATTNQEVVLTRAEWRLAVEMSRPASPEMLADAVGAEPRSVRRVLNGLLEQGLLKAGPAARLHPVETPPPAPAPSVGNGAVYGDGTSVNAGADHSGNGYHTAPDEHHSDNGHHAASDAHLGRNGENGHHTGANGHDGQNGHHTGDATGAGVPADRTATAQVEDESGSADSLPKSKRASALRRLMSQMRE